MVKLKTQTILDDAMDDVKHLALKYVLVSCEEKQLGILKAPKIIKHIVLPLRTLWIL